MNESRRSPGVARRRGKMSRNGWWNPSRSSLESRVRERSSTLVMPLPGKSFATKGAGSRCRTALNFSNSSGSMMRSMSSSQGMNPWWRTAPKRVPQAKTYLMSCSRQKPSNTLSMLASVSCRRLKSSSLSTLSSSQRKRGGVPPIHRCTPTRRGITRGSVQKTLEDSPNGQRGVPESAQNRHERKNEERIRPSGDERRAVEHSAPPPRNAQDEFP